MTYLYIIKVIVVNMIIMKAIIMKVTVIKVTVINLSSTDKSYRAETSTVSVQCFVSSFYYLRMTLNDNHTPQCTCNIMTKYSQ